jgi:hypothetical protein
MPTLTPTVILADIAAAVAVESPLLSRVASDFTAEPLKKGQTAIAHVGSRPSVIDYDASSGGYGQSSAETSSLFSDRSIVIDQHKHVPVKLSYLSTLTDQKAVYQAAINEAGKALGKAIVDDGLAKLLAANFSKSTIETVANTDRDTLGKMRKEMNKAGALTSGRTAIVNSDVFESLETDPRIASKDYYGQQTGEDALGMLKNVAGFGMVMEYSDLPANAQNLTGFGFDSRALAVKTGIPNDMEAMRNALGIPSIANIELITDPASGLTLMGIFWQVPGTFDLMMSVTAMWGWAAGSDGGSAGDLLDYAGNRLVTA